MRNHILLRNVFRRAAITIMPRNGCRHTACVCFSSGGVLLSDNKDQLPSTLSQEEWIGPGTERSGRTFVTDDELAFLEKERRRTSVRHPKPMSPPKRQQEDLDEKFDDEKAFSDQYLAAKGIDYSQKPDDKAVQHTEGPTEEMDPAMLSELAKWNFITSQEDPHTKSLTQGAEMATTIRLKELAECESRADIHTGYYTMNGRLRESEARSLLSLYRRGVISSVEDMIKAHNLKKEDMETLFKYVKSPVFFRESGDDIFTAT